MLIDASPPTTVKKGRSPSIGGIGLSPSSLQSPSCSLMLPHAPSCSLMLLMLLMLLMAPMVAPLARNPTLCSEIFLILR
jgi:hypothetical protein